MGGGLKSDPVGQAYQARGPHVPSAEIRNNLEQPAVSATWFCILIRWALTVPMIDPRGVEGEGRRAE